MNEADLLQMQAALDGEMDALSLAAFEQRLAREPDLARAWAEMQALRSRLRAMPTVRAPDALRARVEALAAPAVTPARKFGRWSSLAASVAALGLGLAIGWTTASHGPDIDREVLAGHLRGVISAHPVDVASSDLHTVKPWFAGKLTVAPAVPDLAASGFRLEGGRIDVIAGEPAPTLVYQAGKHLISVTRLPDAAARILALPGRRGIEGHSLLAWRANGVSYVAASDAAPAELDAFETAFSKATTDDPR